MDKAEELKNQISKMVISGMDIYDASNVMLLVDEYANEVSRERAINFLYWIDAHVEDGVMFSSSNNSDLYDEWINQEESKP